MNSIYGAIGNAWFVCFNPDVAEAVTIQGQDLIKYSEKISTQDTSTSTGIRTKNSTKIIGLKAVRKVVKPLVVYGDTDSNYVSFQDVIASCDWEGDPKDLILLHQ
jgi:DNA polymerase elongation subunit (family B)